MQEIKYRKCKIFSCIESDFLQIQNSRTKTNLTNENCCQFSEKLYRIRAQCQTGAAIHTEKPNPVQVVGLCYLSGV